MRPPLRICVLTEIAVAALWLSGASSQALTITEFLAANTSNTPADEGGPAKDWIEIHNENDTVVDTDGWHLTDEPANLTKWKVPSHEIPAGGYLVVHASGSDLAPEDPGEALHTNFKLRVEGEFLALVEPNGKTIASQFVPQYPPQRPDFSYGILPNDEATPAFFRDPTPGKANGAEGVLGFVEDTKFSMRRGFFALPFNAEITTATKGAEIRYSTDGSEPTLEDGMAYTEPIEIAETTVLRAAAFKDGFEPTNIDSQTYLFTADVIKQRNMDKDVVEDPLYADVIEDSLKSIPTMSLVLPRTSMFGGRGIYTQAGSRGDAWERAVSIEFFDPSGEERDFQIDGGIRIHGADARNHAKKPMKLYFREQYGASKLRYPLFEGSPVQEFDRLLLRGGGHEAWSDPHSIQARSATYVRDEFHRLTHLEMGHLSPRGRFVQLYINGDYWGLYNLHERADHFMGSAHLGGEPEDYDVIKTGAAVVSGKNNAWRDLQKLAERGLEDGAAFTKVVETVDLESFIDYMTVQIWTANVDWLRSQKHIGSTGDRNKNWYAFRKTRKGEGKWHFFVWDSEFGMGKDHTSDRRLNYNMTDVDIGNSPGRLYAKLKKNDDFRVLFGDQLQKHFFNGGAMTPENNLARFDRLVTWIREAVVAESARWGDQVRRKPYTRDDEWQDEVDWIRETWMVKRNDILIEDFREIGLYPEVDAPELLVDGKPATGSNVLAGSEISFQPASGVILYTLDGSDPRASAISAESATIFEEFVPNARAFVPTQENGGADLTIADWTGVEDPANIAEWKTGDAGIGFEARPGDYVDLAKIDVSEMKNVTGSAYIRVPFTVADQETVDRVISLTLSMKYDDGFIAYLNGTKAAEANAPGEAAWDSTATESHPDSEAVVFETFDITAFGSTLRPGHNILAIHGLNSSARGSDAVWVPKLDAQIGEATNATAFNGPVTLDRSVRLKARVLKQGEYSALTQATVLAGDLASAENIVVSEIHYRPLPPQSDGQNAAGTSRRDFEFIELTNIGQNTINLTGAAFTEGIAFAFEFGSTVAPGKSLVLANNAAAFQSRYGAAPDGEFSGNLANNGEMIALVAADKSIIKSFEFSDTKPWPEAADGDGPSLELVAPESNPDHTDPKNWTASAKQNGTPETSNTIPDSEAGLLAEVLDLSAPPAVETADGLPTFVYRQRTAAKDFATVSVEVSTDLISWKSGSGNVDLVAKVPGEEGLETVRWKAGRAFRDAAVLYFRIRVAEIP